jgi:hypothetical protein
MAAAFGRPLSESNNNGSKLDEDGMIVFGE